MELNKFSDMHNEEINRLMNGINSNIIKSSTLRSAPAPTIKTTASTKVKVHIKDHNS